METLYSIAVLLISGLIFSRILGKLNFPDVTGYLIGGIIVGPSVLKILSSSEVNEMNLITQVALSFIAFSIGVEMNFDNLKKIGARIFLVTIMEALGAFIFVFLTMYFVFKQHLAFSIVISSIACATAPASTLMVIKQYRAKGDLVDCLIPVVAMDDAACIIAFGISSSVAISLVNGKSLDLFMMFFDPLKEIVFAIILGVISGFIFSLLIRKMRHDSDILTFSIAAIFITTAICLYLNISQLLCLMVMGLAITNLGHTRRRFEHLIDKLTPPIYIGFFVLSGADLDLKNILTVGVLGIGYILMRVFGKVFGAYISTKVSGFPKSVQKNLGLTLAPQAGVAIGLSLVASHIIPQPHGQQIRTIILGATIVYELIGPMLAKFALKQAGCIEENSP